MKILVVNKTTNLDLFGEQLRKPVANGQIDRRHLDRLQASHDQHLATKEKLLKLLDKASLPYTVVARGLFWPSLKGVRAVVTIGGDGTVLEASHHIRTEEIPVIGIRSSQMSVGHLCAVDASKLEVLVERIREDALTAMCVRRLQATVTDIGTGNEIESDPILNDFLFCNSNPAATTRYRISHKGSDEEQKSSGVWVSTPLGSTAAISAAGAPVMKPEDRNCQYWVRELYREPSQSHQLQRGFFNPSSEPLELENYCRDAVLALDGHHAQISMSFASTVRFHPGPDLSLVCNLS